MPTPEKTLTKRQHALHELLSSERAYASDLALVREVHIPLALGQPVPHSLPVSPPNSSGSSSRTVSTASDGSVPGAADLGPPMTQDDVKLIFGNITEIAVFSDLFCQALEEALGDLLEGGKGDDHVGALFLSIIPELERPYKQYITRHPTALNHLQQLPQTPAVQNYLSYTQTIASSLTHAWDLSSLLIKPVQRLLKYPLLLTAIIDETPDSHSDNDNLKEARRQLEEVARNVNEGRRRAEVVRDVLTSKKKPPVPGMTVSASVSLTKVKSLKVSNGGAGAGGGTAAGGGNGTGGVGSAGHGGGAGETPEEAILVSRLERELKDIELFAQKFAKNIVEWARMTSNVISSLRTWSLGFSKVIGLSPDQGSEAFDAFLIVVEKQLMPLCVDLEGVINERVLKELAHLLMTMTQPLKLLASMNEQEPYHYHLMNMNVSPKNRPPPSLLSASTNYLALRGQLAAELPTYIALLHQGLKIFIHRLAGIQTEFWAKVRDQWLALWEMLRLEEELNVGGEETVNVWFMRWSEVNEVLVNISVVQDPKKVWRELRSRSYDRERIAAEYRDRDHEKPRERELDPEADAEYYTLHHLQTFAHHHSTTPDSHSRSPNYDSLNNNHPNHTQQYANSHTQRTPPPVFYSPSIPPSSPGSASMFSHSAYSPSDFNTGGIPNSPNSFATSFSGDRRDFQSSHYHPHSLSRERERERERERDRPPKKEKKSSAQAANTISMLGALEPPVSPKHKQKGGDNNHYTNSRNSGVSGISGPSGNSGAGGAIGKRNRAGSDLGSTLGSILSGPGGKGEGGGGSSWMSSVGLASTFGASGGIVAAASTTGGGGGPERGKAGKKSVQRKTSNESFVSKTTVRSPASSPLTQHHPSSPQGSPKTSSRPPPVNTRQSIPHPQPHRRRTTGGPAPEDLRDYEVMMIREQERVREREFAAGYHHQQQQQQQQQQPRRPSIGGRSGSSGTNRVVNANTNDIGGGVQYPHHAGLPRTKSMPLPYHPYSQARPQSSGNHSHAPPSSSSTTSYMDETRPSPSKRGAGEYSTEVFADEDSELFYQSNSQSSSFDIVSNVSFDGSYAYQGRGAAEEYENNSRSPRPRERRDATVSHAVVGDGGTRRDRAGKNSRQHSRQRSVGKEDESRKRYSEHSNTESKPPKGEKDKEKPSSSRKRSGSIKSITSFFTSNRDSGSHDKHQRHGHDNVDPTINTPSLSQSPSILTTSTTLTDHTPSPRDSWASKPAKYTCVVTHPCKPPSIDSGSGMGGGGGGGGGDATMHQPLSYFSFPFFTLKEGELYDILQEAGHPSLHPNLPLIVDEGEDCLLLCRSRGGEREGEERVGWALASFLEPCSVGEDES